MSAILFEPVVLNTTLTILKKVGQSLQAISPQILFRLICSDQCNDVVGEHFSVRIGAAYVSLRTECTWHSLAMTYMVSSFGSSHCLKAPASSSRSIILPLVARCTTLHAPYVDHEIVAISWLEVCDGPTTPTYSRAEH